MKKILSMFILFSFTHNSYAQTYDEWFRQKKTQIQYLLNQIAANGVYIQYIEKGYKIGLEGLTAIGDIKHGEFNLHLDFFNSLESINPAIKKYTKVADIITRELQITSLCKATLKNMKETGQFTAKEVEYVSGVFLKLLGETANNISELTKVVTAGSYKMTDDQRMKQIDGLYEDMRSKYAFAKLFGNEAQVLSIQRFNEASETKVSQSLYNLK